jgi:hypothetical protein
MTFLARFRAGSNFGDLQMISRGSIRRAVEQAFAQQTRRSDLAEGVGLEPTSPFGQRFSSVWSSVLTGSDYSDPIRSVQVSDNATS